MLKIRLQRTGKKNQPFFRIVVTEKNNPPRGGRAVEILGFFNPQTKEKEINAERVKYWISVGAQPSDRVHNMLISDGIIKGEKKAVHAKAKKKEGDEEKKDAPKPEAKVEEKKETKQKEEEKQEAPPTEAKVEEAPKEEKKEAEKKEEPKKEESKEDKKQE